jgi:signal peptidase II
MWIIFIIACALVLLDQITKVIVEVCIEHSSYVNILDDILYLTKTYNTGAGWSMMDDNTLVLALLSLVASIIFIYITCKHLKSFKKHIMPSIAMSLALGGCVGNMVDRFLTVFNLREGVIDFIGMYIGDYSWPIYNLADIFLVIGVIVFAIWGIFFSENNDKKKEDKKKKKAGDFNA